jgi:uncharacterized protein (TIGR04206 family)
MANPRRRLLLVALLGVLPWSVVQSPTVTTLFFPFGFLNLETQTHVVTIYDYLFVHTQGLYQFVYAWPLGVLLYLLALGSAALGLVDREDRRVTAGLLALVGLTQLQFALGWGSLPGRLGIPVATITTLTLVWWVYWPDLKGAFFEVR